ncbi:MAG: type II toxin-antitoxin system VapB family antitoxin [Gemmatimonadaceae bacterium]|nr:type II toxin-antitoxin system VapB family antitoxin [Gemmatimonadaceae bacterium]
MALNIKNPLTERLAQEVAHATGETLTEAVTVALRERLAALRRTAARPELYAEVRQIQAVVRELPDVDVRGLDEILYDNTTGLPR